MPAPVRTYMNSTSESLSHPETSYGRAARGGPAVSDEGEPVSVYNNGELAGEWRSLPHER